MRFVALLVFAACSAPATPSSPRNAATPHDVTAPTAVGSLALVTKGIAADPDNRVADGARVRLATTRVTEHTARAKQTIKYGCDDNELDVTLLDGPQLTGDVAWVAPATIAPTALRVVSGEATAAQHSYTIGPLTVGVTRDKVDLSRGELTIARGPEVLLREPFQRVLMEGAADELRELDLRERGPAVPTPIAAWDADGWQLVVIERPGFEGTQYVGYIVDTRSARTDETLALALYQCAF